MNKTSEPLTVEGSQRERIRATCEGQARRALGDRRAALTGSCVRRPFKKHLTSRSGSLHRRSSGRDGGKKAATAVFVRTPVRDSQTSPPDASYCWVDARSPARPRHRDPTSDKFRDQREKAEREEEASGRLYDLVEQYKRAE